MRTSSENPTSSPDSDTADLNTDEPNAPSAAPLDPADVDAAPVDAEDSEGEDTAIPEDVARRDTTIRPPTARFTGVKEGTEILIITGRSGAGRTQAANALEDLDYYVVDNLPPTLLLPMAGLLTPSGEGVQRLAAVVDVRSREFFQSLVGVLDQLQALKIDYRIVFLDADDATLIQRFEKTRRPHPLQDGGTLLDGLDAEKKLLAPLLERADEVVNTSELSIHDLARFMRNVIAGEGDRAVKVTLMSFGFKHGLPMDADQVLDVRFLQNPYWIDELRALTGRDKAVADYVLGQEGARRIAETYASLIEATLPGYQRELKPVVSVAIGCTGGRHRSVAMAESVGQLLRDKGVPVRVLHRDVGRK